jgi:competence protein ComEC
MAQGRAGGRTVTWPTAIRTGARRAASGDFWPAVWAALQGRLQAWLLAERSPGRLIPWMPVAFGVGIALYFTATTEPALWAASAIFIVSSAIAFLCRRRSLAFSAALLVACICAGFACATAKAVIIAHPVLLHTVGAADVTGWVEGREDRERTDRIVVAVTRIDAPRMREAPQRIRVTVRKGAAPRIGSYVTFKARLNPPLPPLRPGGYDFGRDLYFQRIGATGFVLGSVRQAEAPHPPRALLRFKAAVHEVRDAIDARIRTALPGDAGAIASALITGKRDAISAPVNEAMYVSSLAHVLSISGYHMALLAGVVFFFVRGILALFGTLAIRHPIKKWAAGVALCAATGYLILSGAEIATQRAFIMTAIVLVGVMVDRSALTLRTLAIAAFGIMIFAPEAIVHPSFQMSFAATLALVAAYERGLPWIRGSADTSAGARVALWGGRELLALVVASVVAGLATTLYAAFHFHRLAPYGVLANLLAMPIVSAIIMPFGLLAVFLIPLGLDGWAWKVMGYGIDWMVGVAQYVAALPGAVGRIAAFDIASVLIGTAGLVVICLLRSPLRWAGVLLFAGGVWLGLRAPLPDLLVSHDAQAVAVRSADGQLAAHRIGSDTFSIRSWLAANADARAPGDASLRKGVRCDPAGCTLPLAGGGLLAFAFEPEAFSDDCRRAALIVTRRHAPPNCPVQVIDRDVWRHTGAIAGYRRDDRFELIAVRPPGTDRPWSRATPTETEAGGAQRPPRARDATPAPDDLRADD